MACEHPNRYVTDSRFLYGRRWRNYVCPDCGLRFKSAEVILYQHNDAMRGMEYKSLHDSARCRLALVESLTDAQAEAVHAMLKSLEGG